MRGFRRIFFILLMTSDDFHANKYLLVLSDHLAHHLRYMTSWEYDKIPARLPWTYLLLSVCTLFHCSGAQHGFLHSNVVCALQFGQKRIHRENKKWIKDTRPRHRRVCFELEEVNRNTNVFFFRAKTVSVRHVVRVYSLRHQRKSCASSEYDEETQKEMEKRMNAGILVHRTFFFDFLLMRICGKSKRFDGVKVEPNERALVCLFWYFLCCIQCGFPVNRSYSRTSEQ